LNILQKNWSLLEGNKMTEQTLLDCLYNELTYLDEIAGEMDEEINALIDSHRQKLAEQIRELEAA